MLSKLFTFSTLHVFSLKYVTVKFSKFKNSMFEKFLNTKKINSLITLQLGTQTEIEQHIAEISQQETVQVMTTRTLKFRTIQYN